MSWGFRTLLLASAACTLALPGGATLPAIELQESKSAKKSAINSGGSDSSPALWAQPRNLLEEDANAVRHTPRTVPPAHGSTPEKLTFLNTVTFSRRALQEVFEAASAGAKHNIVTAMGDLSPHGSGRRVGPRRKPLRTDLINMSAGAGAESAGRISAPAAAPEQHHGNNKPGFDLWEVAKLVGKHAFEKESESWV